jgi:EmrB/QacA subfamily drug resistance transporter
MCLAVLLAQVDTSVVNLAVHSIGSSLGAAVSGLQWVLDAYNLAYALLLLTGGLLADLYGRRRLFLIGAAIFTGGSVLCAAASNIQVLIAARVITGAGAAMLLPASLAIIRVAWPEQQVRNHALGVWAACNGLAFIIGPTVGGMLVDAFGWRSVFLIAVPFGLMAIGLAWHVVDESLDPAGRRFDGWGQLWGATALGGLAFAGIAAGGKPAIAGVAFGCAAVAFTLFLFTERRHGQAAMVPLDLFRHRAFAGAMVAFAAAPFGMYGLLFLVPLVWQAGGTLAAGAAGLALVPMAAVFFVLSNIAGRLAERIGARTMIAGGTALIGGGSLVISATGAGRPVWLAEIGLIVAGLGMGLNTGPLFGVAVGAVPAARSGSVASLINVARMVGATLGVAVLGTVLAAAGAGEGGLRAAMLLGGTVQLAGACVAWRLVR